MKFDITIPASVNEQAEAFRSLFGVDKLVWIAASTHEGEEEIILKALKKIQPLFPNLLCVIVPRHPERFNKVEQLCRKQGFIVSLRSQQQFYEPRTEIFIGDTMGELLGLYAASDIAFVGGSLLPIGGHNLLEPAALSLVSLTGPHVNNFEEITRLLMEAGAAFMVHNASDLADKLIELLQNKTLRIEAGLAGKEVVIRNKGAMQKHLRLIDKLLTSQ